MRFPPWIVVLLSALVILFGIFRITLGFQKPPRDDEAPRKGLFAYPRRTQILIGTIYVVLGVLLILPVFGIRIPLFGFLGK
ncbi:MAG TPA: hypothetical protein VKE22_14400 [Haliangiales bacterium]|nr:hypothetical protein [Haliangiales bacterium]